MKKIFCVMMAGVLFASCGNDILDSAPSDRYTEATFWTTEANANMGLTGCYNMLRAEGVFGGTATPLWEETATPNAYNYDNSGGWNVIAAGTQTGSNSGIVTSRWAHAYEGIGRCNTLLAKIGGVPMDEKLKDRMKAEATFLRALYYALLEMYYGGVPLILDQPDPVTQASLPRNTREEIVAQVLKDLDAAAAVLPLKYTGANIGRATKGAALALKARVLLFEASPLINTTGDKNKWKLAADAAKAVMDLPGTGYDLFGDYRSLFLPANDNSIESVFDVQFTAPTQGSSYDLIGRQYNTNAPVQDIVYAYQMKDGLPQAQSPYYDPAKPYDNRDPRMYATIVYPGDQFQGELVTPSRFVVTGYGTKKYTIYDKEANPNNLTGGRSEINYMVIRFADVLLMYAEAQNEVLAVPDDNVREAVNRVRRRAKMPEIEAGKTQDQMRAVIRQERRIELAFEGFYYTDIRRWKIAETVNKGPILTWDNKPIMTRTFDPKRDYWWPIPDVQRDRNPNLGKNPGY
ncbi:RagB/SusD family nutrient uptake outer membrane protein [Chitinophaga sp. GCM10012297]|uniref:RagB/SusD family nutrient uptake outer membrane protein n=1 Tax=Chitinophaga chungangae TaxID=2821488 RepID=A0ABS3YJZ2_9BACT|nr:RagB/SusD family nutrient uptake outer membrane protein [Chitinophaga chungangae]MBO9155007.1 RagB/SusD family nutrient uptake outer membrane protein [Chitinophaga chungangae]